MSFKSVIAVTLVVCLSIGIALAVNDECQKKCRQTFPPHTTDIGNGADSCERGCRLFLLIDGVAKSPDDKEADTLKTCKHSCEDSFEKAKDKSGSISACQSGCEFQKPVKPELAKPEVAKATPQSAKKDELLMPSLTIEFPDLFEEVDDRMPSWVSSVHKSMQSMHNRMMNWMTKQLNGDDTDNEDIGDVFEKVFDMKHDMMMKPNPLDNFFDSNAFEVIDPTSAAKDKTSNEDFTASLGPNRIFEIEIIGPYQLDSAQINGIEFKDDLDGPRLPEEGLKSRGDDAEAIYLDQICKRQSEEMSWSDFVSCVHYRMRTPRWLTVASISLCIIFILWLCLVIPSNAPKQRVRMEKDVFVVSSNAATAAAAKEKEAQSFVTVRMAQSSLPNDLPPSYEEIANLKVKLEPVHQAVNTEDETKSTKI